VKKKKYRVFNLLKIRRKTMKGKIVIVSVSVFLMLAGSSVFGQTNISFMGVGGMLGYVSPESNIGSTIALGARADLGTIFKPNIRLIGEVAYWSKGYDVGSWNWSYSQLYISALAKYRFAKSGSKLVPYAGGGLGFVFGKVKTEYKGPSSPYYSFDNTSSSNTDLGIHAMGGVDYTLSPNLTGFAEFRYCTDGADFWGIFVGAIYNIK